MRAFWIGVVVLAAITAGVFLIPTGERPRGALVADTVTPAADPETEQARGGVEPDGQTGAADPASRVEPVAGVTNPAMVSAEMPGEHPRAVPAEAAGQEPEPRPGTDMPYPKEGAAHTAGPGLPVTQDLAAPAETPDTASSDTAPETTAAEEPGDDPAPDETSDPTTEPVSDSAAAPSAVPEKTEGDAESSAEPEAGPPPVSEQPVSEQEAGVGVESKSDRARRLFSRGKKKPRPEAVVETPEGLLLNGRWEVAGKGTEAEPYRIGWDLLVAAKRVYQPRRGKDKIPEWIMVLHGKRVTIEGYTLLPVGATSLQEMLVMLNQWDGCCIGVPPTPYDAIEVNLRSKLTSDPGKIFGQGGAVSYGRITGRFEVDPYLSQGWLLGLYLINDARADLYGPAGSP